MALYKNAYTKQEDQALWLLHEIRYKMSCRKLNAKLINKSAKKLIDATGMSKLKFIKSL